MSFAVHSSFFAFYSNENGHPLRLIGEKILTSDFKKLVAKIKVPRYAEFYPSMLSRDSLSLNKHAYDFDFNNFFVRSLYYILSENKLHYYLNIAVHESIGKNTAVWHPITNWQKTRSRVLSKLEHWLEILQKQRSKLKRRYAVIVSSKFYDIPKSIPFRNFKVKKTKSNEMQKIASFLFNEINANFTETIEILEEMQAQQQLPYNIFIIDEYSLLKYSLLAAIGKIKHYNEPFWWCIMNVANSILLKLIIDVGIEEVLNVYVDSIQVLDKHAIKRFELIDQFPLKLDKAGKPYVLVCPANYAIGKEVAAFSYGLTTSTELKVVKQITMLFKEGGTLEYSNLNIKVARAMKSSLEGLGYRAHKYIDIDNKSYNIKITKLPEEITPYFINWDNDFRCDIRVFARALNIKL